MKESYRYIWNKRYKLTDKIYVFNSVMCCHKTEQFDVIQIPMDRFSFILYYAEGKMDKTSSY